MAAAAALIPCPHFWKGEGRSDQEGGEAPTWEIQSRLWISSLPGRLGELAFAFLKKTRVIVCLPEMSLPLPLDTPPHLFSHISFLYLLPVWDREGSVAWVEGYCKSHPIIFPHPPVSITALNFIICKLNYHPICSNALISRKKISTFLHVCY